MFHIVSSFFFQPNRLSSHPRVAQRDALPRELALDLPLANGHLSALA